MANVCAIYPILFSASASRDLYRTLICFIVVPFETFSLGLFSFLYLHMLNSTAGFVTTIYFTAFFVS